MRAKKKKCQVDGCRGAVVALGWCRPHYAENRVPKLCSVPECGRQVQGGALCPGHYMRMRRNQPLGPLGVQGRPIDAGAIDAMVRIPREQFEALTKAAKTRRSTLAKLLERIVEEWRPPETHRAA